MNDVNETLSDREKRYGSYEKRMAVLDLFNDVLTHAAGDGYKHLPFTERHALYLICDKMSRILCGKPGASRKDSWHDIAGYATLVERSLVGEDAVSFETNTDRCLKAAVASKPFAESAHKEIRSLAAWRLACGIEEGDDILRPEHIAKLPIGSKVRLRDGEVVTIKQHGMSGHGFLMDGDHAPTGCWLTYHEVAEIIFVADAGKA